MSDTNFVMNGDINITINVGKESAEQDSGKPRSLAEILSGLKDNAASVEIRGGDELPEFLKSFFSKIERPEGSGDDGIGEILEKILGGKREKGGCGNPECYGCQIAALDDEIGPVFCGTEEYESLGYCLVKLGAMENELPSKEMLEFLSVHASAIKETGFTIVSATTDSGIADYTVTNTPPKH